MNKKTKCRKGCKKNSNFLPIGNINSINWKTDVKMGPK